MMISIMGWSKAEDISIFGLNAITIVQFELKMEQEDKKLLLIQLVSNIFQHYPKM